MKAFEVAKTNRQDYDTSTPFKLESSVILWVISQRLNTESVTNNLAVPLLDKYISEMKIHAQE